MRRWTRTWTAATIIVAGVVFAGCERDVATDPARDVTGPALSRGEQAPRPYSESAVIRTREHLSVEAAHQLADRVGVTVVHAFHFQDKILVAYDGAPETRDRVTRHALVDAVRHIVPTRVVLSDLKHWGFLARYKGHGFLSVAPVGYGVRVAILDTGVDCDHPDLVTGGIYGTGCGTSRTMVPNDPYSPYEDPWSPYGHGTAVAGVIVAQNNGSGLEGAASEGWFNSYRIVAADGYSDCEWIAAAVEQAVLDEMDVINISGGFPDTPARRAECVGLEQAITSADGAGVLVVVAAGNTDIGLDVGIPAVYDHAMAVSGVTCDAVWVGFVHCTSNAHFWNGSVSGPEVDIAAAAEFLPVLNAGSGWRLASGTSFAAPMVTAAAMAIISTYEDTRYQSQAIRWWLQEHAYGPGGQWANPNLYGAGILDVVAALAAGSPCDVIECYIPVRP